MKLSVVVITKDEESNIGRCLEQVKWADEIIVVDADSVDKTIETAKRYTDKIFSRAWTGFVDQRSFALSLAACDLVLILDADEILDEKAVCVIKELLSSGKCGDGYRIRHEAYFLGRKMFFAQPSNLIIRLFKRGKGYIAARPHQQVDEGYGVHGGIKLLAGTLKNYTSNTIAERVKKIDTYSTLWAAEQIDYGARRPGLIKMVYAAIRSFVGNFFIRGGFLDGFHGLVWCVLKAAENFLKYAKLWERKRQSEERRFQVVNGQPDPDADII